MRLLLSFILTLSLSLACDQPYEDVGGVKIGCPLDPSIMSIEEKTYDANIIKYRVKNTLIKDPFLFDVIVEVLDGNIEQVLFVRLFTVSRETEDILLDLKNKWGKYEEMGGGRPVRYIIREPKSEVIDSISTASWNAHGLGHFHVTYTSKKMKDYLESSIKEKQVEDAPTEFYEIKNKAEKGDANAQYDLGVLYYDGKTIHQDYAEAFKWFKKAADQWDLKSISKVSKMYRNGQGVEKNLDEWEYWMDKCHEIISHCW